MKICIPVTHPNGLNSEISEHFGRAPHHIVVDSETLQTTTLDKGKASSHGHCLPVHLLLNNGVDTVLCKGMGRGALTTFTAHHIEVRLTEQRTVADAIIAYQHGTMPVFDEDRVCQGHDPKAEGFFMPTARTDEPSS